MPKLTLETRDKEKSVLLLLGENPLIPKLVEEYEENFTLALVSKPNTRVGGPNIYRIKPEQAPLVKNLEERIEYGVIFLEEQNRKFIGPVLEKLSNDKTKTAILIDALHVDHFYDIIDACKNVSNFNLLFLGDVYSEDPEFNPSSPTAQIIENALKTRYIRLTGNDLKPLFPIYLRECLNAINQTIFGRAKRNKFYFLFYRHPQTYISAIHEIEKVLADVEVHYEEADRINFDKSNDNITTQIQTILGETPAYLDDYFEGFEHSVKYFAERGPIKPKLAPKIINAPKTALVHHKSKIETVFKIFIFAFLIFIILNFAMGVASLLLFKKSVTDFKNGNYKSMQVDINSANSFFNFVNPLGTLVVRTASLGGFPDLEKNYTTTSNGLSLLNIVSSDFDAIDKITQGLSETNLAQKISDAFFLYFSGQKLKNEIKSEALNTILMPDLSKTLIVSQVLPQILGYDGEKKYLLLFQNNAELRPGGGFIGSLAELDIKNGKIESINLQDVYADDGQLKVHVEPYYIIRRYLQPHLYLRDSNFDLDFQESASKSALLYNLETGHKVDGVIAINFEAVRQIIGVIGPIKLSGYNQTLTSDNAFDFLEKTIDNNFFPGSTQKKDVLQALFNQIMNRFSDKNSLLKVASLIPILSKQKQIIFAFNQNSIQSAFSSLDLGDEYKDLRTITANSINDFLSLNEANISVNKVNLFVTRSTTYNVSFSGNKISSQIIHTLSNDSLKDAYKVYIRFATPLGSTLSDIKIDGVKQVTTPAITNFEVYERKSFKAPATLEVNQDTEAGYQVFGFIETIAPKTNRVIQVDYTNGLDIPSSPIVNYSLYLLKQPGTDTYPFVLNLNYGENLTPQKVENATLETNSIVINDKIDQDKEYPVQLIKR